MCEELEPILHTREKVAQVLHRCEEYLPILHTSEIIKIRILSTNFGPQNLSKLTIRKFYIWQMSRIGNNSSYGCEICEMKKKYGSAWLSEVPVSLYYLALFYFSRYRFDLGMAEQLK